MCLSVGQPNHTPPSLCDLGDYSPYYSLTHKNNQTMAQKTFKQFQDFDSYCTANNMAAKDIKLVLTTNGYQLLAHRGTVIATIHRDLKGRSPQQTARNITSVSLCFGIPHDGGLPCLLENKSQWETIDLF
jgi:hypothetical protein